MRATQKQINSMRSGQTLWSVRAIWDRHPEYFMHRGAPLVLTSEVVQHTVMGKRTTQVHRSFFPENVPANKRPVIATYTRFEWAVLTKKQAEFDDWHANHKRGAQPEFHPRWVHSLRSHLPEGGWLTFTSRKAAQRFAQEILDGLWPKMVENAKDHYDFCKSMAEMSDYYDTPDRDDSQYESGPPDQEYAELKEAQGD